MSLHLCHLETHRSRSPIRPVCCYPDAAKPFFRYQLYSPTTSHLTHLVAVYSDGSIITRQVINPNIVDFSIVPIYNELDTESGSSEAPEDNRHLDFASTQSTRVAASADIAESVPILSAPFNHDDETDPWETPVPTLLDNVPINIGVAENPIDIDNPSTIFPSPSNIISYENNLVTGLDTEPLIVPPPAPIPRSQVPCNSRSTSVGIPITDSWTTAPWGSLEDDIRILPTLLNRLRSNTTPGDSLEYPIELGETGDSIVDPINVDEEEGPSVPVFTGPTTTTTHTITNQRGEIFTITNNLITAITAPNFPVNVTAVHVNVNQYTDDLVITLQSPPGIDDLDYCPIHHKLHRPPSILPSISISFW
ncbi:hypothetical protein BDP27DRAFT_1408311 [Rhodocollybia butyracea]|uniref:Uncharacterized protein n=1 Tax=Rhodocollybia butyracea TaxID=206335 RepID=A0A9P5P558_9AGAR|nr:hypothetical protein BDP27DRAFT_1408311 [Rhodocollybia butyracea]